MRARESQRGITFVTLVAALAVLVIIVAFVIGALRHSTGPQSPSSSEVAGSTPPKQTAARPTAERPIARSEKRVDATPSKNDIFSDPNWEQRCFERTREIMARLEAWQRTTSPGDALS